VAPEHVRLARQGKKNGALVNYGLHLTEEKFSNSVWRKRPSDVFASETPQTGYVGPEVSAHGDQRTAHQVLVHGRLS